VSKAGCLRRQAGSLRSPELARVRARGFTVIELLIVMSIIIVLAGLILATSGYVQKKGARSRAEAEVAAMSAALESYKADNGIYPRQDNGATDTLDARTVTTPTSYEAASLYLYTQLSGNNPNQQPTIGGKSYFGFKPQMLGGTRDGSGNIATVTCIRDPFGNSYGYSTAYQRDPRTGYNPTFDLWSTVNETDRGKWIKNW